MRLPAETRFPDDVKEVIVRVVGYDRAWDMFFLSKKRVTDDFMTERASQESRKGNLLNDVEIHVGYKHCNLSY